MMQPLKVIVLTFLMMSLLLLAFSLLIPSTTKVSRAITVAKPIKVIHQNLMQLNNWKYWHKGFSTDTINDVKILTDKISSKQFDMTLQYNTDTTLQYLINLKQKQNIISNIQLLNHNDSTTVQWLYTFKSKWYPWEKFASLLHDNIYGSSLDSNLAAFKIYMEKQQ